MTLRCRLLRFLFALALGLAALGAGEHAAVAHCLAPWLEQPDAFFRGIRGFLPTVGHRLP